MKQEHSKWFLGLLAASLPACSALSAYIKENSSVGSFQVVNTMSVPVCAVSLFHKGFLDRTKNDLGKKVLGPGERGTVSIPLVGDPSAPESPDFGMHVYGCNEDRYAADKTGQLLATVEHVDVRTKNPIVIR